MSIFKEKKFDLPQTEGISEKQINEHLKLYQGYVKHSNKILDEVKNLETEGEKSYLASELRRRFAFEFDGMRSHEYYFGALEGGPQEMPDRELKKALEEQFGDLEGAKNEFKKVATGTRGSGWAMLYWDDKYSRFQISWIDEHHLGHLSSLDIILAVDMWEHAYMVDYLPGEKGKYFDSYLKAINWETVEEWFKKAQS